MTPPPPLIDTNGRPFPLEHQLAAGGQLLLADAMFLAHPAPALLSYF